MFNQLVDFDSTAQILIVVNAFVLRQILWPARPRQKAGVQNYNRHKTSFCSQYAPPARKRQGKLPEAIKIISIKQVCLYRMVEKKMLTENEAKILNALFEHGNADMYELQSRTGLDAQEIMEAAIRLESKKILVIENGIFFGNFLNAMQEILKEKEKAMIVATA